MGKGPAIFVSQYNQTRGMVVIRLAGLPAGQLWPQAQPCGYVYLAHHIELRCSSYVMALEPPAIFLVNQTRGVVHEMGKGPAHFWF